MRILDAYILARTKRKTRRIRTSLVIFISALLFAVLVFGSFAATGLQKSSSQFKDVGYNGRYLTSAHVNAPPSFDYATTEKNTKAQMDAELRARGHKVTDTVRNSTEYQMELAKRVGEYTMAEDKKRQAAAEQKVIEEFSPKGVYHLNLVDALQSMERQTSEDADPYLTQQKDVLEGKSSGQQNMGPFSQDRPTFHAAETDLLTPLLQPGESFAWQPGQAYPVLMPYPYIAKIAGQSFTNLGSQEKIDVYAQLIHEYTGKELTYCYRNAIAQEQVSAVLRYNKQADTDKDASTKPIPITTCQDFDQAVLKKAGLIQSADPNAPKPLFPQPATIPSLTKQVKVKVVGFVPTQEFGLSNNIFDSLFSGVNSWQSPLPAILPSEVVAQDELLKTPAVGGFMASPQMFYDFATRDEQKRFIDSGCSGMDCVAGDKLFIMPFGSIKVALEGTLKDIMTVAKWVVLGIAALAALMIAMTISKVIADSRREIAVFRALGARRRDIAQIYFTYGLMLAGSALVVSLVLAVAGALIFSAQFSANVNAVMVNAVGAYTMETNTVLFGVNWLWLAGIAGVLLVASLIGIAIPVLLSNRKNLVNVMRDE